MIKKPDKTLSSAEHWRLHHFEKLDNFILADGEVRGAIISATQMVREMQANHEIGVLETLVLGHAYMAAMLMAENLKGRDRLAFQVECSGPIKGLTVEANAFGEVRGYLRQVPIPVEAPLEDFNLSPFFGAGFITITKYIEDAKSPFSGQVMMQKGNIAEDLAHYFWQSEQTPSAFHLSVYFDEKGQVAGAGGLMLQVLPEARDDLRDNLNQLIDSMPSLGKTFARNPEGKGFAGAHFDNVNIQFTGSKKTAFMCHCNNDKIEHMLKILPIHDLQDMAENGPFPVEIKCQYCNTPYYFSPDDLQKISQDKERQLN
jgi:molecular chaperone Hsp33